MNAHRVGICFHEVLINNYLKDILGPWDPSISDGMAMTPHLSKRHENEFLKVTFP